MKLMDRFSQFFATRSTAAVKHDQQLLSTTEIRLIVEGQPDLLVKFAESQRIHAIDPKGDTPLHLAARRGSLSLCDVFVRAGADPGSLNHDRQTPADVASVEGHIILAGFLSALVAGLSEPAKYVSLGQSDGGEEAVSKVVEIADTHIDLVEQNEPLDLSTVLDEYLSFNIEEDPEAFFVHSLTESVSGIFVPPTSGASLVTNARDGDWDLDLSPANISGDGIALGISVPLDKGGEHDFLKVRNRGPRSVKRVVVQTSTRLEIDPDACIKLATEVLAKGWCSFADLESLIADCEGNGDLEELSVNLQRVLEVAGFDVVDHASGNEVELWDAKSDVSAFELAEAMMAALTRATMLPGTQRFVMDKSNEVHLVGPLVIAKQELHIGLLACKAGVDIVLDILELIIHGDRDPSSVSLRTIIPSRPDHNETEEVFAAVETLKSWQVNGRTMDGKQRRKAMGALVALDLSIAFYKELVHLLADDKVNLKESICLDRLVAAYEAAADRLIRAHLPYARRFASRNVEESEDPEDVFQVAFTGLQRSTRRFDPARRVKFSVYCSFWMKQALKRWRADEGSSIRVPVHLHDELSKFDSAVDKLVQLSRSEVSDDDLASELECSVKQVRGFRKIPRHAYYPESVDEWDNYPFNQEDVNDFDQAETKSIIRNALAELRVREADVIRMRFGIDGEDVMTLEEIGQIYGVTRERVRQIEAKALLYLSHPGRKRHLEILLGR